MLKNAIRINYHAERLALTADELRERTAMMLHYFIPLALPPVQYLLSYHSLVTRNEFDISRCEEVMKVKDPSISIAWPRIAPDLSMEAHIVEKDALLVTNKFNIPEPVNGAIVLPEKIDMIFVPLLAFDRRGYRVGYGKGFYDRFLPRCRPDALRIGFSFFDPLPNIDDINEFDVPLNLCITPTRLYEF